MICCRNTGFRSMKFYNNKESKHANEFIISGAIKSFAYLETKTANKQTDFNQQFKSMSRKQLQVYYECPQLLSPTKMQRHRHVNQFFQNKK